MIHQESLKKRLAKLAAPIFIETLLIMMLGAVDTRVFSELLGFIREQNIVGCISLLEEVVMQGRELWVSAALSQCISNVPAAVMLSGFTENANALLLGVNLGGLGTPIASLASLISYQFYSKAAHSRPGKYLGIFSAVNFGMLAILLAVGWLQLRSF